MLALLPEKRALRRPVARRDDVARRVQKHKRTQDRRAGTFHIGQAQATLDLISKNSILGHKILVAQEQLLSSLDYNSPMVFERIHDLKTAHAR